MRVVYKDEYGNVLFEGSGMAPPTGSSVVLSEEVWRVAACEFYPKDDAALVVVTQNQVKLREDTKADSRLSNMNTAIIELTARQTASEKSNRMLREQLNSLRQYIRRQQPKPKEQQ
jgi:hypothetical protein